MKTIKRVQIIFLILLGISFIVCIDLTHNYFNACFVEEHDGILLSGVFSRLIYGDGGWSLYGFYQGFIVSLRTVAVLAIGNIVLKCIMLSKHKEM